MEDVRSKEPLKAHETVKINNFINISKPPLPSSEEGFK